MAFAPSDGPTLLETVAASLRGRADVDVAVLFGSQARGTARPDSDVDIAVLAASTALPEIGAQLSLAIGREVDVVSLVGPTIPLLDAVIRDGVLAFERTPGQAAAWRTRALLELETDRPWYARMRDAWLKRVATRGL